MDRRTYLASAWRGLLVQLGFMLILSTPALGRVIYVDDDAPPGGDGISWATAYRYLQDALADAKTADKPVEVRVAQGVYKPDQGADQMPGDRLASFELISGVTLKGAYAGVGTADPNARDVKAYKTVLSGDLADNDGEVVDPCDLEHNPTRSENSCNVVEIAGASGVRLEGLAITGGHGNIGARERVASTIVGAGARIVSSQGLLVKDCTFLSNYAGHGPGGCAIADSTNVAIEASTFARNSQGGLTIGESTGTLLMCEIADNHGHNMGGMAIRQATVRMTDCIVKNNVATYGGGGGVLDGGSVSLEQCTISGNWAKSASGGGMISSLGTHKFIGCSFSNNRAATEGGALSVGSNNVTLNNCILSGNVSQCGGAISGALFEKLNIVNCTATGNRAERGSFLSCEVNPPHKNTGEVSIVNSIILDADNASEITTDNVGISVSYSLLGAGPNTVVDPGNKVTLGIGNIDLHPSFAEEGYWDANGMPEDPADDFYVAGDYHLTSQAGRWDPKSQSWAQDDTTSPCIDAGDPNSPIGMEPFPNGGRLNMGAYGGTAEASKSYFGEPPCEDAVGGDIDGDCRVDWKDLALLARHWLEQG